MCRHLAYLGPPATLRSVIIDPPYGLYRQAWAPRRQRYGTVNADGFGVGWYAAGDPVPARYRRPVPIWGDESFADVARVTSAGALLAAVRSATAGTDPGTAAAAPYAAGRWLFSHNGVLDGPRRRCSGWRPGSTPRCCGRWSGSGSNAACPPPRPWRAPSRRCGRPAWTDGSTSC